MFKIGRYLLVYSMKIFRVLLWTMAILLLFSVLTYFLNQEFKSEYCGFRRLYRDSIENIVIYKFVPDSVNECRCSDSLILSEKQANRFVRKWNSSYSLGPYKYIPKYTMTVKMKNGNYRYFNVSGVTIKEFGSYDFHFVCDNDFLK